MSGVKPQRRGTPQTRSYGDSTFAVAPATFFLAKLGIQFLRGRRSLRFAPGLATLFPFRGASCRAATLRRIPGVERHRAGARGEAMSGPRPNESLPEPWRARARPLRSGNA